MKRINAMRNVFIISLIIVVLTPAMVDAEGIRQTPNSVYLELGGSGILYTVNYERFVQEDFSVRAGAGFVWVGLPGVGSASLLAIPVTASYFGVRSGEHALELGGGAVLVHATAESDITGAEAFAEGTGVGGTAIVGYRYLPRSGGFNFRAAFTPIWGEGGYKGWAGVAFGFLF